MKQDPTDQHQGGNSSEQSISRRKLLKIMGTTSGAVAVSAFVPNSWLPPQVEIGVLPAHAQATAQLIISNLQINSSFNGEEFGLQSSNNSYNYPTNNISNCYYEGRFDYSYPISLNNNTSELFMLCNSCMLQDYSVYNNNVEFDFIVPSHLVNNVQEVCVQFKDVINDRLSNQDCADDLPPCNFPV